MNVPLSSLPTGALIALAVLAAVQVVLDVIALVDLYRRPADRVASGNKWLWVAVILLANLIGAILYLVAGRKPVAPGESVPVAAPSVTPDAVADALYGPRAVAGTEAGTEAGPR
jgi:hypothetical protein